MGPQFLDRTHRSGNGRLHRYVLFVPRDYAGDKPYPLLLFLHGAGECGSDGHKQVEVGLGPAVRRREETFPFLVVFPQARRASLRTWQAGSAESERALAILDAVSAEYRVDPRRVALTGISMGGYGTWSLAAAYPGRWAAIVPVCGGGDPEMAAQFKHLPCWAFHGALDRPVPVTESREMIAALEAAGGTPKYTEYPDVAHNCWDKTYDMDALYVWLLRQRGR
jgi:predicted peptidase